MVPTNFESAIEKARVKRAVAGQLSQLSPDAQRDVLADLLLAIDANDGSQRGQLPLPNAETVVARPTASRSPLAKLKHARGRPTGARNTGGQGRTEAIYRALLERPGISIAELAKAAYPGEEDVTHKVRAILWSLKKQGRAKNPDPGKWEVVT
jgi:hypothetical protein